MLNKSVIALFTLTLTGFMAIASAASTTPAAAPVTTPAKPASLPPLLTTVRAATGLPIPSKAVLLQVASELDTNAAKISDKLRSESRTALAPELDQIRNNVRDTADKLTKATNPEVISLLSEELSYLEKFLAVELEVLLALDLQIQHVLELAANLEQRIAAGVKKVGSNTAIGKALESEGERLRNVMDALQKAKDGPSIQEVEMELVDIITVVNIEIGPIAPTGPAPM